MTCRVLICAPDGTSVEARALLDNASSASFVSQRLAQSLHLPRAKQNARISGIAGLSHNSTNQSLTSFSISPVMSSQLRINITAVVVPKVTCDLPFSPIPFKEGWSHLSDLELADPVFGQPGRIDLLLWVDCLLLYSVTAGGVVHQELLLPSKHASAGFWLALPKFPLLPNKSQPIMSPALQAMIFSANFGR